MRVALTTPLVLSLSFIPKSAYAITTMNKACVIVGGGPVGLACAVSLSQEPHGYNVTVLEQTAGTTSVREYNPSRSFLYNINQRGLSWFQQAGNEFSLEQLQERGVSGEGLLVPCIIPAQTNEPIRQPKAVSDLNRSTSYWIPRHDTVDLFTRAAMASKSIAIHSNKVVTNVQVDDASDLLRIYCQDGTSYTASLVIAADGIHSTVRTILADDSRKQDWLHSSKFRIRKYKSPATGLKIKVLQLPPNFTVTNTADTEDIMTVPDQFYSIRGVHTGSRDFARIGLLPVKGDCNSRPGNFILPHDHELWTFKTGAEAKAWMTKCFPRMKWDEIIDDAEWERFVQASPTTFPHCQYSPGSSVVSPSGKSGIALVGDACTYHHDDDSVLLTRCRSCVSSRYWPRWAERTSPYGHS